MEGVKYFNAEEIREKFTMHEGIKVMEDALSYYSNSKISKDLDHYHIPFKNHIVHDQTEGYLVNPLRNAIPLFPKHQGIIGLMPAVNDKYICVKFLTIYPQEEHSHQGLVLFCNAKNGKLLATFDASEITAIRTAAVSGVAAKHLARRDSSNLVVSIFGSGVQARSHAEAFVTGLPGKISKIIICGRETSKEKVENCVNDIKHKLNNEKIEVCSEFDREKATREADIICLVTSSKQYVVKGEWLKKGSLVVAVGASQRSAQEIDLSTFCNNGQPVEHFKLFVDSINSTKEESSEVIQLLKLSNQIDTIEHDKEEVLLQQTMSKF
ncbi:hypothetical protein ABK040_010294 [Willaertia magna]